MSSSSRRWASASVTDLSSAGRSPLPAAALSPVRPSARRSPAVSRPDPASSIARTIWPSSSSSSNSGNTSSTRKASPSPSSPAPAASTSSSSSSVATTLADHLAEDSLDAPPAALSRQRSCTELIPRFADADAEARKVVVARSGGHANAIGRSMRLLPSTRPAGVTLTPGRVAPSDLRRLDAGADVASSGSECSDASRGAGGSTPRTKTKLPKPPHSPLIARTNSTRLLGSSNTQWALSPGRRSGSPLKTTLATVPELKGKTKSLIGLGWGHLFSRRKAAAAETATGAQATATLSSPASRRSGGGGNREIGHQMMMMHCRLLQWRFANAKAEAVSKNKLSIFEVEFMGAWARISELQGKVARRRVQLEKENLKIKLNSILSSQMRGLESWAQLESKHAVALDSTVVCTQAAICKLPLTNGAKIPLPSMGIILQQALDLTMTTKTIVRPFTPMAHDTTLLITELVAVAREEHALLQECLELLGRVSALQVEEESLRCHMLQS
uniref:QWRF motif-containing protein 3 n=1 Tax=Oryza meridionalis TaxID=40149 RepID=A0A0E0D366_9ORYZ